MTSFQISVKQSRRAAARFIGEVHRLIHETFEDQRRQGLTQSEIARRLEVHRSVINRELRGAKDITLGRVGELAWAMGKVATVRFVDPPVAAVANTPPDTETLPPCVRCHHMLGDSLRSGIAPGPKDSAP